MSDEGAGKPLAAKEDRAARLAAALRQNLRRRKAQARAGSDAGERPPSTVMED